MNATLHRNSTRLRDYDYASSGAYFVTICTAHGEHLFGEVVDGQMILSQLGWIALETWNAIPEHFPSVFLDEFVITAFPEFLSHPRCRSVVRFTRDALSISTRTARHVCGKGLHKHGKCCMPNHIHGIVCIELPTVGARHASPLRRDDEILREAQREMVLSQDRPPKPVSNGVPAQSLGAIIGSFKAAVTKRARASSSNADLHIWQRGDHDHIVRNDSDLERTQTYISTNPLEWALDEYAAAVAA